MLRFIGPSSTPFSNQILHLEIKPTDRYAGILFCNYFTSNIRYPIEPPIVRFKSPLRHPNVDEVSGRICLDLLRMPPEGSWRPNISFGSLIVSIMVLLSAPNLDDPVRPDLILEWTRTNETETEVNSPIVLCNAVKKLPPSLSLASLPKRLKKE